MSQQNRGTPKFFAASGMLLAIALASLVGGKLFGSENAPPVAPPVEEQFIASVAEAPLQEASSPVTEIPRHEDPQWLAVGQIVFNSVCSTCHHTGWDGAPGIYSPEEWLPRLPQGREVLQRHAIEGFGNMEPNRGAEYFSDDEELRFLNDDQVRAGTDYMLTLLEIDDLEAALSPPVSAAVGQQIYETRCQACHSPVNVLGAPRLGNAADWTARVAQGMATVYRHAIEGIGIMPPKGGHLDLTDEEVRAAVDYMIEQLP